MASRGSIALAVLTAGWVGSANLMAVYPAKMTSTAAAAGLPAQAAAGAAAAARLSGTWKLNRELSPLVAPPGRGGGGGRRGGAPSFAVGITPVQRGGGGGGGGRGGDSPPSAGDLTPDELAGQAALQQLQQIPEVIAISATADAVTLTDPRGKRTYAIDGKTTKIEMGTATINAKTRWDKDTLRQEFWNPQRKLIQLWEVDGSDHLVLRARLESMTMSTPDLKAVFDRQ
jgi:hypothetical protein